MKSKNTTKDGSGLQLGVNGFTLPSGQQKSSATTSPESFMEGHATSSSPFLRPSSATSSSNSFYHESNNIGTNNGKYLELDRGAENLPITNSNLAGNSNHPGDKHGCDAANDDDEDRLVIADESVTEPVKTPSAANAAVSHNNNNEAASSSSTTLEINNKVDRFLNHGRPSSS